MEFVADIINNIPSSGIRKYFDIASEMDDVVSLSVGEPDFVTPWEVREAAIVAIERGYTHYTSNHGIYELREEVCKYMHTRFGLEYSPEDTLITVGASEGIDLSLRGIINPGDEVLVPAPSYVSYMPCISMAGGKPVAVKTFEKDDFALTVEELKKVFTNKTKALILPYPNNPTGGIMTKEQLAPIANYLKDKDIVIISDEIYAELTYGQEHVSIASFKEVFDKTVVLNGFSKAFAMTGWRVGYALGPKDIIAAMVKIHQYTMLCASSISQIAAMEALKLNASNGYSTILEMKEQYNRRRLKLLKAFRNMGLKCFEPKGAFYIFPNISKMGMSSDEFCTKLLYEKKVALVPGDVFGDCGSGFVRCSYAASMKNIEVAIERIGEFINK